MAGYTDNSITVEWQPQNNLNYKVNNYSIKDQETGQVLWTGDADTVKATVQKPEGQSGVQFEVYNAKKKRIVSKDSGNLAGEMMKYAKDSAYRYRARCYYYNGNWRENRYFAVPSVKVKKSTAKKGINVTLKKGAGISKYTVYVSKKYNRGYKKAKTVKVAKKKTYSLSLKKYGKKKIKKGTYFVKVVPTIKDGNKTYQSETIAIEVVCVR